MMMEFPAVLGIHYCVLSARLSAISNETREYFFFFFFHEIFIVTIFSFK